MTRGTGTLQVRSDHGVWAAGWRLAVLGVVRTVTPRRRTVLLVSMAVVAAGLVVAVVVGLTRGLEHPVSTVVTLVGAFALLGYLVAGVELLLFALTDRRRVAPVAVDVERLDKVRSEIRAGRSSMIDPVDRRRVARFARVQQQSLPATVLVQGLGVSVGVALGCIEAASGGTGLIVLGLAVVIVAITGWGLVDAVRALGTTPELVALDS
jgi:hypothetical protein